MLVLINILDLRGFNIILLSFQSTVWEKKIWFQLFRDNVSFFMWSSHIYLFLSRHA